MMLFALDFPPCLTCLQTTVMHGPVLQTKSLFSPHDATGHGFWDTGLPVRSEAPIVTPSGVIFSSSLSFMTFGVACRSTFYSLYSGLMYGMSVQNVCEQGV